jgi:hypothetical protein
MSQALKPQDIVILLKILAKMTLPKNASLAVLSQNKLAMWLCLSPSEVNAGIKRLIASGLLGELYDSAGNELRSTKGKIFLPIKTACEECLISGVKYFFPAELGSYTRGIPTSYAASIFKQHIRIGQDPIPIWSYAQGEHKGLALEPLYSSVPRSVHEHPDPLFYDLLTLIDAIRSGRARERNIGIKLLKERLDAKS